MSGLVWGWPALSKKAHVFAGMRSLCGRWLFLSKEPTITEVPIGERGPDDCAACHKKLVAHFKPATPRVARRVNGEVDPPCGDALGATHPITGELSR